ncbi:DUF3239 domain-containing protein [Psychrobacter sp. 1176_08]|uniref:DUF3239 domain-containing protein n=1 Tax=Psychrobacter sp. 1176_08 TaxID=2604452 RepID=UPI004063F869
MRNNYTVDDNSVASNPGNAELNKWVWFCHNKMDVGLLTLFLICSLLAAIVVDIMYLFIVVIAIVINLYYWTNKKEHFLSGDSNGGIVVDIHPTLIAVNTNLTKGYGDFPVVKITKRASLKNVSIGDRVPTVALYTASTNESLAHWLDFNPIPLSYATNDVKVINLAMQSYPNEQWEQLEKYLLELEKPYKTGLYQVDKEQSGWNGIPSDAMSVLDDLEKGDGSINFKKIVIGVIIFIAILKVFDFFR